MKILPSLLRKFSSVQVLLPLSLILCANISMAAPTEQTNTESEPDSQKINQEAQVNLQYLLGKALEKSKVLQETHGDFSPYGAALFENGTVKYVWYTKPGKAVKDPALTLPIIRQALHSQASTGVIIGSAVIYKFKKPTQKQTHLTIELEYYTGLTMAFATEMIVDSSNNVTWGSNNQGPLEPRVFVLENTVKEKSTEVSEVTL